MASINSNLGFDSLGYAQALIARGFERDKAEALAVITRDFVISGQATSEFVQAAIVEAKTEINTKIEREVANLEAKIDKVRTEIDKVEANLEAKIDKVEANLEAKIERVNAKIDKEVEKLRHEITTSEKRMTLITGKMLAFSVGIILAGIPIIQALIAKFG